MLRGSHKDIKTAMWDILKKPAVCKICGCKIKKGEGAFIVKKNTIGYPHGAYCDHKKKGEESCAERVYGDYLYGTEVTYHKV